MRVSLPPAASYYRPATEPKAPPSHEARLAALIEREQAGATPNASPRPDDTPAATPPRPPALSRRKDGRWQKKIRGRIHYFGRGTEAEAMAALAKFLAGASHDPGSRPR